ncbi:hypothetical protein PAPYR_13357 [Paratrimastix pyriformis]|uniref:Uncharacterized protein n=1 Tax=Paratrimastix pyriformis TaxID=342808 RepID=A0ABQ8U3W4_9EUKA|nr:hypothetical protein PAPYR_13357 [Paratrimastix pyriformis]
MKLYVKLITPNTELGMLLDQQYLKSNVYQYERFNCNNVTVPIPSGNFTYPIYDGASRPAKIFIGFQNVAVNDALTAATAHPDPSLFEPSKITKIFLEVNGSKNIPYLNQRELGFRAENFGQAYTDLMRCSSMIISRYHPSYLDLCSRKAIQYLHLTFMRISKIYQNSISLPHQSN